MLPGEVRASPVDLAALDVVLRDAALLEPIAAGWRKGAVSHGRPTISMATYVRLMVIKQRTGRGYESMVREVSDSIHLRRFCLIADGRWGKPGDWRSRRGEVPGSWCERVALRGQMPGRDRRPDRAACAPDQASACWRAESEPRLVSMFEPDARPIRRGKLGNANEFGYVVQICEVTESTKRGARGFIKPVSTRLGSPNEAQLLPDTVSVGPRHRASEGRRRREWRTIAEQALAAPPALLVYAPLAVAPVSEAASASPGSDSPGRAAPVRRPFRQRPKRLQSRRDRGLRWHGRVSSDRSPRESPDRVGAAAAAEKESLDDEAITALQLVHLSDLRDDDEGRCSSAE